MKNDSNVNVKADSDYRDWLAQLKDKLRTVQIQAAIAVNREMLQFYWELGADIVEKQKSVFWGDRFLPQLSQDLSVEFPEMKGFSVSNLKYMRQWFLFYAFSHTLPANQSDLASQTFVVKRHLYIKKNRIRMLWLSCIGIYIFYQDIRASKILKSCFTAAFNWKPLPCLLRS